jgi:hypothetical protein
MKKFIFRSLVFLALFCLFCAVNYGFNQYQIDHNSGYLLNTKTLIIGDSQIEHALNPDFFKNSRNVAKAGEPYISTFYKLKFLLKKNPQINRTIVGLSLYNLTAYNDTKFVDSNWSKNQLENAYPFLNLEKLHDLPLDKKRYWQTQFRHKLLLPKTNHEKYLGHFVAYPTSDLKKLDVQQRIHAHYYNGDALYTVSQISLNMLDSIIQLCDQQEVELVFVVPPLHLQYRENIPEYFQQLWKTVLISLENKQVNILNYSEWSLPDDCFRDYNHLNKKGADLLSKKIVERLKTLAE